MKTKTSCIVHRDYHLAVVEKFEREIITLRARLVICHAWMRKAGHLPGCAALISQTCPTCKGKHGYLYDSWAGEFWTNCLTCEGGKIQFKPGTCSCGLDDLLTHSQSSPHLHALEQINTLLATHGAAALPEITRIVHKVLEK